ncbi:MAG: hypothetical protein NVSMB48_14370 [Marmoricola sp.]
MDRRLKRRRLSLRRWLAAATVICLVAGGVVLVTGVVTGREGPTNRRVEVPDRPRMVRDEPGGVAKPVHLASSYTAPPRRRARSAGELRLARLGIAARVVAVGWDGTAMAVPDDPATLGWFEPSAALSDRAGVSLIAGHVSDRHDRAGPLARLVEVRVGDVIAWQSGTTTARFIVVRIGRYPRTAGLPTSLFRVDGPHVLRLVTCTDRKSGILGFHYADNLVVSAQQLSP